MKGVYPSLPLSRSNLVQRAKSLAKVRGFCIRAHDSNQSQIEKLKNEIISRRDDDSVPRGTVRKSNEENQPFFNFPLRAQRIEVIFCVARRLRTRGYAALLTP